MATNKETRTIEIIANGTKVEATFKDMQKAASLLENQIKNLPKGSDEFVEKSKKLQEIKANMKSVKDEMYGVQEAQSEVNQELLKMGPLGGVIDSVKGKFNQATGVISKVTGGFNTLRGAIISTGLGALVVALGLVINYLTSTQDGMDKVQRVLQPLNVIFQRFMGILQELGGGILKRLTEAINNPKQAFSDLIDFIKQNVMNRIKSVSVAFEALSMMMKGNFSDGAKKMGDAFIQASTGITDGTDKMNKAFQETKKFIGDSIDQGTRLADLNRIIEETENDLIVTRAKLNREFQESKEIAADVTKSEKERVAAARRAQNAQNELLAAEQKFLDLKIERKELENSFNDTSRADEKELRELIAERTDFEATAAKKRTAARGMENSINKEISDARKKRLEEEAKLEEENLKKVVKAREQYSTAAKKAEIELENLQVELIANAADQKIAKLELNHQREMEAMEVHKQEAIANIHITESEKQAILDTYREQQELKEQALNLAKEEVAKAEKERKLQDSLKSMDEEEAIKQELLTQQFALAMEAETAKEQAKYDLQKSYIERRLALLEEAGQGESLQALKYKNAIIKLDQEKQDALVSNEKKTADLKSKLMDQGFQAAKGFLSLGLELMSQDEEAKKRNANKIKAFQKAQVIADGIREVAGIWKNANANPINMLLPGAGTAIAIAQTAMAAARTGMAVQKINATAFAGGGSTRGNEIDMMFSNGAWQMPDGTRTNNVGTFARGGHVRNASFGVIGERGSEWVGPNWMMTSPKYANIFRYLEGERIKGRAFAVGGTTTSQMALPAAPSGAVAAPEEVRVLAQNVQELKTAFELYAARVDTWASTFRVVNDPRDTADGIRVFNEIEADSTISR
jgi:hypothetical protein